MDIKDLRKHMGITQADFAKILGVSRLTIIRWEAGYFSPSPLASEKLKQFRDKVEKEGQSK